MEKKSLLLIGGTGVLSSAVTNELLCQGFEVTMINRGNRPIPDGVFFIKSNCNNFEYIKHKLANKKFDAVIDFLCFTKQQLIKSYNFYSNYTNQYFFISSCAVYNTELGKVCNEESPKVLKIWQYSVDKWDCEKTLMQLAEKSKCNYTIIRPAVTYDNTRIPYGIAPQYGYHWTLISRILAKKPIITWNNGINRVNMLRVEDFAVGIVGLVGNEKAKNEAFNICADDAPTFKDVLNIISEYLGQKIITVDISPEFYANNYKVRKGEILGGRAINSINSNQKIKLVVPEFKQTISLSEGVKRTLKAYEDQNYQKGIDWQYDACTDRIIKKWCKINKINYKELNIRFIDYFGKATFTNRIYYFMEFHKDNYFIFSLSICIKILKKIKSIIK